MSRSDVTGSTRAYRCRRIDFPSSSAILCAGFRGKDCSRGNGRATLRRRVDRAQLSLRGADRRTRYATEMTRREQTSTHFARPVFIESRRRRDLRAPVGVSVIVERRVSLTLP